MEKPFLLLCALALAAAAPHTSALAQDSTGVPAVQPAPVFSTKGFSLGIHLLSNTFNAAEDGASSATYSESGGGYGIQLSYGFNQRVSSYVNFDVAVLDEATPHPYDLTPPYGTGHLDLGVRVALGKIDSRWRFPIEASLSSVVFLSAEEENQYVGGGGLTLGAGAAYFVSPSILLAAGLDLSAGRFSESRRQSEIVGVEDDFSSARVRVGAQFYLARMLKRG